MLPHFLSVSKLLFAIASTLFLKTAENASLALIYFLKLLISVHVSEFRFPLRHEPRLRPNVCSAAGCWFHCLVTGRCDACVEDTQRVTDNGL